MMENTVNITEKVKDKLIRMKCKKIRLVTGTILLI